MKRLGTLLLTLVVALATFSAAFYVFLPKDAALAYLWGKGTLLSAEKGVGLESAALTLEESPLRVVLRNARLSAAIASAEAGSVTITPLFIQSLLSISFKAEVRFESLALNLPMPGQAPLVFTTFSAMARLRPSSVTLEGVSATGDLLLNGALSVNLQTRKIEEAEMAISGERSDLLELAKAVLPLSKEPSGDWILRRKRGESK